MKKSIEKISPIIFNDSSQSLLVMTESAMVARMSAPDTIIIIHTQVYVRTAFPFYDQSELIRSIVAERYG